VGERAPPRTTCSHAGGGCGRVFFRFLMRNPTFGGQFGPENKPIEGQPNKYNVICRNASVLVFHLWPTIFAGVRFRLQNIYRNGVPPHSHTTTPLSIRKLHVCGATIGITAENRRHSAGRPGHLSVHGCEQRCKYHCGHQRQCAMYDLLCDVLFLIIQMIH